MRTSVRHIPDEELHAYLDQALSRSQCVEIECHLAACPRCRDARDTIASLRDRTTALLGLLGPRRVVVPPSFAALQARPPIRTPLPEPMGGARWRRWGLWAASLGGAVLVGFTLHSWLDRQNPVRAAEVISQIPLGPGEYIPFEAPTGATSLPLAPAGTPSTTASSSPAELAPVRLASDAPAPAVRAPVRTRLDVRPLATEGDADFEVGGLWKTVSWEEAETLTRNQVPRIIGLPVLEVRVQERNAEERPLVIVAQQHPSGAVVRTVEGPVTLVADLLTRQSDLGTRSVNTSAPTRSRPDYVDGPAGTPRRSIRVLTVSGRLPIDSLNALSQRIELQ